MLGVYYKKGDRHTEECLVQFKELLNENKVEYRLFCDGETITDQSVELIVVLGGDGSVLRSTKLSKLDIPIVAVNTGNVGFLTSYEPTRLKELLDDIKNANLVFSKRRLMRVTFDGQDYFALNDAVITKNHEIDRVSECIKLNLKIDEQFVDRYVGDGLVFGTPTGSTAYAISAGGPIMVPNVEAYVVAPICAHSLHSRPIVFSLDSTAEVTVSKASKECALFVDGKMVASLPATSSVKISTSDKFVRICDESEKFFSRLSEKLNQWSNNDLLEVDHG